MDAVELMLAHDPNLGQVQARLSSSEGALLNARGQFDPVLSSSAEQTRTSDPTLDGPPDEQRTLQNIVGLTKKFRTGLSISPDVSLFRTEDLGAGSPGANLGTVGFTIRQPLLRGRGREAVAAGEISAERELAASRLDVRQTLAERLAAVAAQYWNYKASLLDLEILQESENRSRELLETTRRLIESDVTPAAEVVQVEADVASQETSRIAGEQALFSSRQDLGREIGLDAGEIRSLSFPADPFPTVAPEDVPPATPGDAGRFIAAALTRRDDLRAARERQEGTAALLKAADNALRPQFDLIFRPSYSGLIEGTDVESFYSPLFRNVPGASSSLGFSFSWPAANSLARGSRLQTQAALRQNELVVEAFSKAIGADVPTALDAVARQALRLRKAEEAIGLFERAVANEEKKLRAGTSTLLDLISQRDRLTNARRSRVSAQLSLALALLDLRFQTGTLLAPASDPTVQEGSVDFARLTTLPLEEAVP